MDRPVSDTTTLEADVREAVEQGEDVHEKVRQLTLRVISSRSLDIQSVRETASAVLRGARAGVEPHVAQSSAQAERAKEHLRQAVSGLDVALAQFAESAKLAVQEAAGRAQKYSADDLKRAREDLGKLDSMFFEALQKSAAAATDAVGDILRDLARHAGVQGSTVGGQLKETLSVLAQQAAAVGRAEASVGLHLARNTADIMRQIAAGVLSGMADRVRPAPAKTAGTEAEASEQAPAKENKAE